MSIFLIRDGGGLRMRHIYQTRDAAADAIAYERDVSPGCREPIAIVEFIEATSIASAAPLLLHACLSVLRGSTSLAAAAALENVRAAVRAATGETK